METSFRQEDSDKKQTLTIDWVDSDWFHVWLANARLDGKGDLRIVVQVPKAA